jgi:GTP pyrophosphokinase
MPLKYSKPDDYEYIEKELKRLGINKGLENKYLSVLKKYGEDFDYVPQIEVRIKSKYSIYNKFKKFEKEGQDFKVESIKDLIAFRIITKTEDDCYKFLEKLMDTAELNYDLFDDYIMKPKPNGYRAIQGPLKFRNVSETLEVEVQIMTHEIHYFNTYGPASHIAYKASKRRFAESTDKFKWVEDLHKAIEEHINERETKRSLPIKCDIFKIELCFYHQRGKFWN